LNARQIGMKIVWIIVVFSIGLVGFFIFSADKGDGLEKTMEDAGVSEGEPVYQAPLSYGEDYPSAFAAGVIGIIITLIFSLGLTYLLARVGKSKKSKVRDVKGEKDNGAS